MTRPASFDRELLALRGRLRAFCLKLTRNTDRADDLLQDTLVQALKCHAGFDGRNMIAWLCVIARNLFFTRINREAKAQIIDLPFIFELDSNVQADAGDIALMPQSLIQIPDQEGAIFLQDVMRHVETMKPSRQDALMRCALGDSYDEIADARHCSVGTIKSNISRARDYLAECVA